MPAVERSIIINVPTERVWEAFVNLGEWPVWNHHMREVQLLTDVPLSMDSRACIVLKTGLSSTWEVTEFSPGRSFTWDASIFGSRMSFAHMVEPVSGDSRVVFRIEAAGLTGLVAAPILRLFYARNLRRSLQRLKDSLEEAATSPRA
ncbi:MAG: SRPBCC family protein [Dehalococcoidia bacterium]|nr:MAG: SRPBCC family protein [Dehalococcoidia bacterium]